MKNLKKVFVSFWAVCMLLTLMTTNVMAEPYGYTITLYAGNRGTVNGGDSYEMKNTANMKAVDIQVTDDKYYVKGVQVSGQDFVHPLADADFTVNKDTDYVVAYGISANRVAYTVNYQDAAGNQLAPSNTYYGDVGDRPVVAYLYIENYVPQALAMTRTLSANAAENVFTFVYTPGASDTIVVTTTTTTLPGTTTTTTVGTTTAGTTAGTAAGTAAGTTAGTDAAAATPAGTTTTTAVDDQATATQAANDAAQAELGGGDVTVESADEETPQALQDLDEETPTGNIDAEEGSKSSVPMVAAIGVGIAAVVALGGLFLYYRKKRQEK